MTDNKTYPNRGKFRIFGCPWVWAIVRASDYEKKKKQFLKFCEERNFPAFESMLWFTKANIEENTVDRESAILDTIIFDIDYKGTHKAGGATDPVESLRRFLNELKAHEFTAFIDYSGNKGFRIEIPFPKTLPKHRYQVMKNLYEKFNELFSDDLDEGAQKGTRQMFRIQNSRHQKSGLYSIPLTEFEVYNLSLEQICEIAKQPRESIKRDYETVRGYNSALGVIVEHMDKFSNEKKTKNKSNIKSQQTELKKMKTLRPCTESIIDNGHHDFDSMSVVLFEMIHQGITQGISDDDVDAQIKEWTDELRKHGNTTMEPIDNHIRIVREKMQRKDLYPHGCGFIKRKGHCVVPEANNLKECNEIRNKKRIDNIKDYQF